MNQIIAINAPKRSGKSVLANELGGNIIKFATPVKNICKSVLKQAKLDNHTISEALEDSLKETPMKELGGMTPRRLMQVIGTEFRQQFNTNIWTDIFKQNVTKHFKHSQSPIVNDDLRFPEEVKAIKSLCKKAILVNIKRPQQLSENMDPKPYPSGKIIVKNGEFTQPAIKAAILQLKIETHNNSRLLNHKNDKELSQIFQKLPSLPTPKQHISEAGLPSNIFNIKLINNSTKEALVKKFRKGLQAQSKSFEMI